MILDIFALVVMSVLFAAVIALVVKLGPLPGQIAKRRGHRHADAIAVLGWIGVITLGLAWPVALVWAYTSAHEPSTDNLGKRVAALEKQLAAIQLKGEEA